MADRIPSATAWWQDAVIYQIYVRSFADGNGDGVGDLAGVRDRLPYLADLGVDAIWFNPWYVSPMADGGYDVADYRAIEPVFGDLDEAVALIAEARDLGIRTIVDIVPNHVSDQHEWFRQALAAAPGAPERERFWFRPGRGDDGGQPPNGWTSHFGGPAWTRTTEPDGRPGEWYLHLFAPEQPDLNWGHPEVVREHEDVLRFWFDRGAAGVRIDSAALLAKDPQLPDAPTQPVAGAHPYTDRDELHALYRSWRTIADGYDEPRALVGELWLEDPDRFVRYLRPDELHTAFNFDFLSCAWDPKLLRGCIQRTLDVHAMVGAPATWVLANHDVTRTVTRYGREETAFSFDGVRTGPADLALGARRARAGALLAMALPGSFYLYQGEELGLPEVEDIPPARRQDPMFHQTGGQDPGRDGCRVPLPWSGLRSPYGFSPGGSTAPPWLPQPDDWAPVTVAAQLDADDSMLVLYRQALHLRRVQLSGRHAPAVWLDTPESVLAFARDGFVCVANLGDRPVALPAGHTLLLTSLELVDGCLPPDATAWLRRTDTT